MSVQLLRNTRVFISSVETGFTTTNTKELLVLDDLSFTQNSESSDISLNEAGPAPIRGSKRFIDQVSAGEWSFSTYILPYLDSTASLMKTPDALVWQCAASGSPFNPTILDKGVFQSSTNQIISFQDNSHHELSTGHLFFLVDGVWFKAKDIAVNTASISVDIDGIGTVAFSGNCGLIEMLQSEPFDPVAMGVTDAEFVSYQGSYIKNKLSILLLTDNADDIPYNRIGITAASIEINNNISYLVPATLSRVDYPIGYFTGGFTVTGSLECYLNTQAEGSAALWDKLIKSTASVNSFDMAICLGGYSDTPVPGTVIHIPKAALSIPQLQTEDALSLSIEFAAQGTEMDSGDEIRMCQAVNLTKAKIDEFRTSGIIQVPAP